MSWFAVIYPLFLALVGVYDHFQPISAVPADCTMRGWHQQIDVLPEPAFPERMVTGDQFILVGLVRDSETCAPIANAAVMFDLANAEGDYDGTQRGMVYTNAFGLYVIQSNRPGAYGGGHPHIHLFAGAVGYQPLTASYDFLGEKEWGRVDITLAAVN